jgi:ABC-type Fe3+/spermidine/putrescine transport system ATPase subunit
VAYAKVRLSDLTLIRPLCCNGDLRPESRETRRVTPVVEMKGIVKHFGETRALSGLDFRVERGEVVALLGPNGAGKTTAIAIMLGLRTPSSGEVRLLGRRPRDLAARSRVGVMLQESGVPDEIRVREMVDLFSSYYPVRFRPARPSRAGLEDKERARPRRGLHSLGATPAYQAAYTPPEARGLRGRKRSPLKARVIRGMPPPATRTCEPLPKSHMWWSVNLWAQG